MAYSQNYSYNDGSATDKKIKQMIPILVRWARESWDKPHYYGDMGKMVGANAQSIGHWLGLIYSHVLKPRFPLAPPLNALVCNKSTDLPSDGLDYVYPHYSKSSEIEKKALVASVNKEAHNYDWNPVLNKLGLLPLPSTNADHIDNILKKSKSYGGKGGGESMHHKGLKEYIHTHPEEIGISGKVTFADMEFELPSQDRIDVFFDTDDTSYTVEVKSHISDDADVIRGIYQAFKYKAILDAKYKYDGTAKSVISFLVLERPLPKEAVELSKTLSVTVFENFKIK